MPLQIFPLTGGMQQGYDVRLLPDGVLANAVNCELERVGRVVGRAKYTALGTTVQSEGAGAFVAYDLITLGDRLFAVGDDSRFSAPGNIYEYLGTGTAGLWRPTSEVLGKVPRLPLATRVRDICRPPDRSGGQSPLMSGAAFGGFAALVWNDDDVRSAYLQVVRAAHDQPVFFAQLSTASNRPCQMVKTVALSTQFFIVGINSNTNNISLAKFNPASDTAIVQLAQNVFTFAANVLRFAICKVDGTDDVMIVTSDLAGAIQLKRFTSAGVDSGVTYTVSSTGTSLFLAVEASSSANQVNIAIKNSSECKVHSFNLTTGAEIGVGPFAAFAGDTTQQLSLVRISATQVRVLASISSGTTPSIKSNLYTVSTNTFAGVVVAITDAQLTTPGARISATGQTIFGMRVISGSVGNSPNLLGSFNALSSQDNKIEICKDFEVASSPVSVPGTLTQDTSTGKWYWSTAAATPDGTSLPLLTEFSFASTERRQSAIFGEHLYIAGGTPIVFDGIEAVECGYQERPRIISLTASNGAGQLLSGGEYDYRLHQEWLDAKGDLHLSPPSLITSVTLGASDDTMTAVTTSPHSLRRSANPPDGSAVCNVLSRTLATVSLTAAILIGGTSINPPSSSLNGLTLKITAGGSSFTVTFSGSATTQAVVLSEINTVVSSEVTATAPGGVLVLTSVDTGDGATIQITNGTANTILGFLEGDTATGETSRSKGENFQRAAIAYNATSDAVAAYVTVTDLRKDESDPIIEGDLIRQQVLYSQGIASGGHHAPPPGDYIWAGKERIIIAGQPKRGRFTVSKLVVPGEPAEFAQEGVAAYFGQVAGEIEAAASVGGAMVLWTRKQIWLVTGDGPRRNGVGEFNQADCITRSVGMIADGWMSMVQDDEGVWFQGSDGELYRINNGGQLEWLGKPVREYLSTYPKVVGAVYRQAKREVAFAVTTANGSSGGILRRNALVPDSPAWFFDDVGAVSSIAEYQGRLAYVQAGIVYLQDAAPGSGAFPTVQLDSGLFQGFQALGYGALQELGVLATFRGRCTITLKIGTDGVTFPDTIASWALTSSEYAVGQRVQLLVDAPKQEFDAFAVRAEMSDVTGTTEGAWLHAFAVKSETKPDFVRLAPSRRL